MSASHKIVAHEAQRVAAELPQESIEAIATVLTTVNVDSWPTARAEILETIAQPHYRGVVATFLDAWRTVASDVDGDSAAMALITAAMSEQQHREEEQIELVWTGPDAGGIPTRRTEQALLQVIENAARRLTVVSYAVYNVPRIADAMVAAAARGVGVRIVLETPDRIEGTYAYNTLRALGEDVARACAVFLWPAEHRPTDTGGRHGILHTKAAVADGTWAFLSSANLTEYAFTVNMELGVLFHGGHVPREIEARFDRLIDSGVLVRV